MKTVGILTLSALVLMLGACGSSPAVDKVAIEKSVQGVETNMMKAMADKDAGAFASNYVQDAVLMTPFVPAMRGQDAIRAGIKDLTADPNFKLDFASDRVEVADAGDMAATRGSYTLTVTNPATKKPVNDKGSYVTVFRKQKDGAWKAVFDINTSEVSPAPPPEPKPAANAKKKKGKKR